MARDLSPARAETTTAPAPTRPGRGRRRTVGVTAAAGACAALLLASCTSGGATPAASTTSGATPRASTTSSPPTTAGAATESVPAVIRRLEPSVVTILTSGGLGSGVVYRSDGTIVTNEHVVRGATQVEIAYADGTRGPGRVVAADRGSDLAVVKAERTVLPAAQFQTRLPQVGEPAIALGSPLGFEGSATAGIISGLGREIPGSAQAGTALVDLIQTDAPISPGNSGGALVNATGEVVGINDAYIPPSAGAVSLGFAIPSATVVDVVEQLLSTGQVKSAFVGIQAGRITPEVTQRLGLQRTDGVLALDVVAGGPAEKAGLRNGDVITSLAGEQVRTVEDFLGRLRQLDPGATVDMGVVRSGGEQTLRLTLGSVTR